MILIKNGLIKTMANGDIENGQILIENGKIKAIGKTVDAPSDVEVIDAKGKLVLPGFVEAHCHIGLDNEGMGWEGRDYNEIVDPITPQLRAIDSINPHDEAFDNAIKSGVTTAVTGPGSANVVGGTFTAIKLFGNRVDDMIIKDPIAMKIAFGENPKRCYTALKKSPQTRMAVAAELRELLFKTKKYMADKENGEDKSFDMKLEAMIPVMKKEIPLKAHAHRADDIFTAIRIAKEFDLDITLDHCTDGSLIAKEIADEKLPAFVGPSFGSKTKIELRNKSFNTPADLHAAGVPIAIITDAPVIPLEYISLCAGLAVKSGLCEEEAFKAITINPAKLCGIGDRVGSLEVGKDADIAIWNGNPLSDIAAEVFVTIVDGKIAYKA